MQSALFLPNYVLSTLALSAVLVLAVSLQAVDANCHTACAGGMSMECCACIGCGQGMRFGKRSPEAALFPATGTSDLRPMPFVPRAPSPRMRSHGYDLTASFNGDRRDDQQQQSRFPFLF